MIISVQYMRAIAALLVVLTHIAWKGTQFSNNPMSWFHIGECGVDLFFIISGYIMCHTVCNKKLNITEFLKARLIRIIPLYWVLSILALFIYLVFPSRINTSGGVTDVFSSFFLTPSDGKYLIQNGWTLSYEFYFYMIFSLGIWVGGKSSFFLPAIVLLLLVVSGFVTDSSDLYFTFITNPLLLEFLLGMFIFMYNKCFLFNRFTSIVLIASSIAFVVFINSLGGVAGISEGGGNRVIFYGVPCFLFFLGLMNVESRFILYKKNLFCDLMISIGNSSYSIYLIHPFVLASLSIFLHKIGLSSYGSIFVMVLLLSSILIGLICHRFLEKPLTNMIRNYF